ncbi:MAG: nucleotidyl transferase AbiEii/AbiGii toxin family protein [Bacteroidales bacterium]|nr:nucleotidyl transferase AbiEii/AbiGii toxin family protein [Bacteroidales bacterium]
MLHRETVSKTTLDLIQRLQADSFFESFVLVGGTALALQIGHRISVDIDFFTRENFDIRETLEYLEQEYTFQTQYSHTNTLKGIIEGIFADFISFYRKKYKSRNEFHAIKSLTYFEDIISENWPEMIIENDLSLEKIKRVLLDERDRYLKNDN